MTSKIATFIIAVVYSATRTSAAPDLVNQTLPDHCKDFVSTDQTNLTFHKDVDGAIKCANSLIQIPVGVAKQHITAMKGAYQEMYTFYDISKAPQKSTQTNTFGFKVWSESPTDLGEELDRLHSELPENETDMMGFFDFSFPYQEAFNKLRDAHVQAPNTFNHVYRNGLFSFRVDDKKMENGFGIMKKGDDTVLTLGDRVISNIDGKDPVEWIYETFVDETIFSLPFTMVEQSRANRFTACMSHLRNIGREFLFQKVGDLRRAKLPAKIEFVDEGSTAQLDLVVALVPKISERPNPVTENKRYTALERAIETVSGATSQHRGRALQEEPQEESISYKCDQKKGRCVFALKGLESPLEDFYKSWGDMVAEAKAMGIDKLIYDVNDNGGGHLDNGFAAVKLLVPSMTAEDCPKYRFRLGPFFQFLQKNSLTGDLAEQTLNALVPDISSPSRATQLIANNCTEGKRLFDDVRRMIDAASEYFSVVFEEPQSYANFTNVTFSVAQARDSCVSGNLTNSEMNAIFKELVAIIQGITKGSIFLGNNSDQIEIVNRGGQPTVMTKGFDIAEGGDDVPVCPKHMNTAVPTHPFSQIIFFGSGYCGSTCSTFALTSYLYAQSNKANSPEISFANWGGDGRQPNENGMTGTSYQGGTVSHDDVQSEQWLWLGMMDMIAKLADDRHLNDLVGNAASLIPNFSLGEPTLPAIVQTEISAPAQLGEASLPLEFYVINANHLVPEWYFHIEDWLNLTNPEVEQAHDAVQTFFHSEPPSHPKRLRA